MENLYIIMLIIKISIKKKIFFIIMTTYKSHKYKNHA